MTPSLLAGLVAAAALALAAGAVAVRLLRRAKVRYRELLEAVQLVQRQATELRLAIDETRATALRIDDRLSARVEPELTRLGRHLELAAAAAEVERERDAGRLAPEVAARLGEHLADLDREIAAGERPY